MNRKRQRSTNRTEVVTIDERGVARLTISVDAIDWPERAEPTLRSVKRWFPQLASWPVELTAAGSGASAVCDDFEVVVYVTADDGGFELRAAHEGRRFVDAATVRGLQLVVVEGLDPRRATADDLVEAAADGRLAGAIVETFRVELA